jgi:hypothetical protein
MALVRGPFSIKWGDTVLTDIESIDVSYDVDSEDYSTIQGKTFEVTGPHKASAVVTLLATDTASLAALLPQYHVLNGQVLSTGETVNQADGAIDIVPGGCGTATVYHNLDIIACNAIAGDVYRMVNTRTEIDSVEFDNKLRKISVKLIGESDVDEATIQFFKQNTISVVS